MNFPNITSIVNNIICPYIPQACNEVKKINSDLLDLVKANNYMAEIKNRLPNVCTDLTRLLTENKIPVTTQIVGMHCDRLKDILWDNSLIEDPYLFAILQQNDCRSLCVGNSIIKRITLTETLPELINPALGLVTTGFVGLAVASAVKSKVKLASFFAVAALISGLMATSNLASDIWKQVV